MCIVQNKSFCCTSGCLDLISLSFGGYERILDWFTIFVYCKSLEGCFPFVICSKFYFLTCGCITRIELSFYKLRTKSILVVCVIPVYRYCNINTFWCVGVLKCDCSCFFILGSCVYILPEVRILLLCIRSLYRHCISEGLSRSWSSFHQRLLLQLRYHQRLLLLRLQLLI